MWPAIMVSQTSARQPKKGRFNQVKYSMTKMIILDLRHSCRAALSCKQYAQKPKFLNKAEIKETKSGLT